MVRLQTTKALESLLINLLGIGRVDIVESRFISEFGSVLLSDVLSADDSQAWKVGAVTVCS
jgi:hypothetical protein